MNRAIALVIVSVVLYSCGAGDEATDTTMGDDSPARVVVDDQSTGASIDTGAPTTSVANAPWRVIVDEHQTGGPVDPGIRTATDAAAFDELWALMGRGGDQPSIDFGDEVVVVFSLSYPTGCEFPFMDLDIDESEAIITANYGGNEPAMCGDDENQYLVVVGLDRDGLSHPRYELATSVDGVTATLEP